MSEYIEREAAIEAINGIDWYKLNDDGRLTKGGTSHNKMSLPFIAVKETLKHLPAADVRPVRHGRWTHGEGDSRWMCSVCKGIENTRLVSKCSACGYQTIDPRNYCPNCGADMREES